MSDEKQLRELSFKGGVKLIIGAALALIAIFGGYHGLISVVEWRIEEKINDPEFMNKIAKDLRPAVVFDQNEAIIHDAGAMKYIENIKVVTGDREIKRIIISPRISLSAAPLLEPIDSNFEIHIKRGKQYDWIYELKEVSQITMAESGKITNRRFRLEILK